MFDARAVSFHVDGSPVIWLVFLADGPNLIFQLLKKLVHKRFRSISESVLLIQQLVELFDELRSARHESELKASRSCRLASLRRGVDLGLLIVAAVFSASVVELWIICKVNALLSSFMHVQ